MYGANFMLDVPCDLQVVNGAMDELLWGAEVHMASVYVLSWYFVHGIYHHFLHFVKADWILLDMQVTMSQENENGFNAGSNGAFHMISVVDFEIEIIIHIKMMRYVGGKTGGGIDTMVDAVTFCWCVASVAAKEMTPLKLNQVTTVFCLEGVLGKEVGSECFCNALNHFPTCRAKSGTKGKATLKI